MHADVSIKRHPETHRGRIIFSLQRRIFFLIIQEIGAVRCSVPIDRLAGNTVRLRHQGSVFIQVHMLRIQVHFHIAVSVVTSPKLGTGQFIDRLYLCILPFLNGIDKRIRGLVSVHPPAIIASPDHDFRPFGCFKVAVSAKGIVLSGKRFHKSGSLIPVHLDLEIFPHLQPGCDLLPA